MIFVVEEVILMMVMEVVVVMKVVMVVEVGMVPWRSLGWRRMLEVRLE